MNELVTYDGIGTLLFQNVFDKKTHHMRHFPEALMSIYTNSFGQPCLNASRLIDVGECSNIFTHFGRILIFSRRVCENIQKWEFL